MANFEPLWNTMKEKNISTYTLIKEYNFSKGTLDNLKNNRNINTHTIDTLCDILDCDYKDIVKRK